ncbi:MAG: hypothetical protein KAS32_22730 [Candidatus Peribacteraceae bacterium]|nr:hypothetical protein [Candidatus Peribacteraceae bacterium]
MQLIYDSGYTIYAVVRDSDNEVYNHSLAVFEAWDVDNLVAGDYHYDLTDQSGDLYDWTFPILAENAYTVVYYMKTGGSPAITDLVLSDKSVNYTGTAITDPEAPPTGAYISVDTGDNLALSRLNTGSWDDATTSDKTKAIAMATVAIDQLNFIGDKTDDDQELEFPRGTDTAIPVGIQRATFEISLALLDGADPEMDFASLSQVSSGIANVRATYKRTSNSPHLIAGIPSSTAWRYLLPYLRDVSGITVSRV